MTEEVATAPIAVSSPELEAIADRIREAIDGAVEASITRIRAEYAEPLRALLEDSPQLLAPPREALDLPAPDGDSAAERTQYRCAVEGAKRLLRDQIVDLLQAEPIAGTSDVAERMADALRRDLDAIADRLPLRAEAEQDERHFLPEPIESRWLTTVKGMKRVLRPFRRRWTRAVPVASVGRWVAARLLVETSQAIADLHRLRIHVLNAALSDFRASLAVIDARSSGMLSGSGRARSATPAAQLEESAAELERRLAFGSDVSAAEAALRAAGERAGESFASALAVIGTVERPASSVSDANVGRQNVRALERRDRRAARWQAHERALVAGLEAEGDIVALCAEMYDVIGDIVGDVRDTVELRMRTPLSELEVGLREAHDRSETLFALDADMIGPFEELTVKVDSFLAAASDPIAGRGARGDDLASAVHAIVERGAERIAALPSVVSEHRIVTTVPLDHVPAEPAEIALREAPMRALAEAACREQLPRALKEMVAANQSDHAAVRTEVERLEQAITFNLASAREGLVDGRPGAAETARDLVLGVLKRSVLRIADMLRASHALNDRLADAMARSTAEAADELLRLVRSRDRGAIQAAVLKQEASEQLTVRVEAGRRAGSKAVTSLTAGARTDWARLRDVQLRARRHLGLVAADRSEARITLAQAVFDERVLANLPLAYRRLFTTEPLEWTGFTVGREAEMAVIRQTHQRWMEGASAAVALFGEKGSGKTTIVQAARQSILASDRVRSIALDRTVHDEGELRGVLDNLFEGDTAISLDERAARLRDGDRAVAIVENAEHLVLRRIGGLDVLDDFLRFARSTRPTVFWLITMEKYAWRYLERTVRIHDGFARELDTTTLSRASMEEAILRRHHMSGYGLRFVPDPRLERTRSYRRLSGDRERQKAAEHYFFDTLARIAEGNIHVALFYWLRSIATVEDDTLAFQTPRTIDSAFLETLPTSTLHTVAAIIQHGGLTPRDHAEVFHLTGHESEGVLWALADSNVLSAGEDGQYTVNGVLYRPFVRVLRERNIFG